ncbi:MAG: iron(III) transport system ATP-binding protein [Oceanospirillaceae bacterium]|jgi:iron(III) transport system ATP-binding protein
MSLLYVSELNYSIKQNSIILDFSLEIRDGEIVAILGESGSGKSTLLRLIAALEQPNSGALLLDNERIIPPAEKLIAGHGQIKLVRQDFGLFPNVSLRENISYELRFYEDSYRNERVDKLLKLSGLKAVSNRLPREVSGGEQQRAVIARALADEPRLLLLDEPFSHLDLLNKIRLKTEVLATIREEKSGCIFVTHEVNDAFGIADKMVVIKEGKTLQTGTPVEIYERPKSVYTAQLTGLCNILSNTEVKVLKSDTAEPESVFMIRPEWLIEHPKGISGIIKTIIFSGHFYQYEVELKGVLLKWLSFKLFLVNDEVKLSVNKFWQIN